MPLVAPRPAVNRRKDGAASRASARVAACFAPVVAGVLAGVLAAAGTTASAGQPADFVAEQKAFAAEMARKHGWEAEDVLGQVARGRYSQPIIDAMERPFEAQPWHKYRRLFVTPERIAGGVRFWRDNADLLESVRAAYGVPPELIVAIIGVETNYGANLGKHRALDALSTLAFAYPKRASFFRGELEALLLLARDEDVDPQAALGSYAGALGKPQFIPSSYRAYAVDFDRDGKRDLWSSNEDVAGSVANYFVRHGWRRDGAVAFPAEVPSGREPPGLEVAVKKPLKPNTTTAALRVAGVDWRGAVESDASAALIRLDGPDGDLYWVGFDNFYVITRYNHSNLYAMAVFELGEAVRAAYGGRAPSDPS